MNDDTKASAKVESAYEKAYFDRLEAAVARPGITGAILIQGIMENYDECSDDEDDEEEKKENNANAANVERYTNEQIDTLRHALVTDRRKSFFDKASTILTGGQDKNGFMMFNTRHGNMAFQAITRLLEQINKLKSPAVKFDALFGLTFMMSQYDFFLDDNEMTNERGQGEQPYWL